MSKRWARPKTPRLHRPTNENKEFGKLKDDETIYKLVGPILVKQDQVEAENTVNGRLEFISKEL